MERLSEEVLLHVLSFVGDAACLCRAGMVNRTWHTVASDDAYPPPSFLHLLVISSINNK